MNVMRTKASRFPESPFDVCRKLVFDDAVTANDDDAELQNCAGIGGEAGCFGVDNRKSSSGDIFAHVRHSKRGVFYLEASALVKDSRSK